MGGTATVLQTVKVGGRREVLDQRKAYLAPCQHQSSLVPHNHTRLLIYAKCVRAGGIRLVLNDRKPVMQYDCYQISNSSHLGSHRVIWNLIQIKRKISDFGSFILFSENVAYWDTHMTNAGNLLIFGLYWVDVT